MAKTLSLSEVKTRLPELGENQRGRESFPIARRDDLPTSLVPDIRQPATAPQDFHDLHIDSHTLAT